MTAVMPCETVGGFFCRLDIFFRLDLDFFATDRRFFAGDG
jgi:hypothetical protein